MKGIKSELLLQAHLVDREYNVALPLIWTSYDLILDLGLSLKKIQVKSTTTLMPSGNYQVTVKKGKGSRYKENDFDI